MEELASAYSTVKPTCERVSREIIRPALDGKLPEVEGVHLLSRLHATGDLTSLAGPLDECKR